MYSRSQNSTRTISFLFAKLAARVFGHAGIILIPLGLTAGVVGDVAGSERQTEVSKASPAANPDAAPPGRSAILPAEIDDHLAQLSQQIENERRKQLSLAGIAGLPDYDEIGGDDNLITTQEIIRTQSPACMDIANNGDIFVAIEVELPGPDYEIHVYRSQDGGMTWELWGTKEDAVVESHFQQPSIHIAEGVVDRLFLAYRYQTTGITNRINVSYSDPTLANASWTVQNVMTKADWSFLDPYIISDEEASTGYYVYVVAMGGAVDTSAIWFARSRFQGDPWEDEYEIARVVSDNRLYLSPHLAYGTDGKLHCAWWFRTLDNSLDYAVRYRRAVNFAGAGLDDWEAIQYLTPNNNDIDEAGPMIAASHITGRVLISYSVRDEILGRLDANVWPSYDGGVTWNPADILSLSDVKDPHYLFALPGGGGFVHIGGQGTSYNRGLQRADDTSPIVFTDHESFMDRDYQDGVGQNRGRIAAIDPTRGNRVALVWTKLNEDTGLDSLHFDAEWRADPGFPNLEPGFPLALPAGVISPPGICELDGDPQSEIVFGDADGLVHVVNHDGTALPGWPIDIGWIPTDAPVAVGDLDGDGQNEVVCANDDSKVFVLNADGSMFPGWPVNLGYADSAYVSIGALTDTSHRQVVVCVANKLVLMGADGSILPGFPQTTAGEIRAPAAIGDVDNNGTNEIVILQRQHMNVITGEGGSQAFRNFVTAGKTFGNAPTLADIDLDDDLEIVAPTEQGEVYVMYNDGTDFPGWPFTSPAGGHITSVALANSRSLFEPELAFASNNWTVHSCFHHGGELSGYPNTTGSGWYLYGMPIMDIIEEGSSSVIVPSRDEFAYAWTNFGSLVNGWPVELPGRTNVSAATGDVDHDGKVEVVFATTQNPHLVIYDLGADARREAKYKKRYWPMYGYNSERQGCLACSTDPVVSVPEDPQTLSQLYFAAPAPNPSGPPVRLSFELPTRAGVSLTIYDVRGRKVRRLVETELSPGPYSYSWDGRDEGGFRRAAGVYYVRLAVGSGQNAEKVVRKLVLLR